MTLRTSRTDGAHKQLPSESWILHERKWNSFARDGGIVVNSIGQWFGYDVGKGIGTRGVFNCVAIADTHSGFLAHIAADRKVLSETGQDSLRSVLINLKNQGSTAITLLGYPQFMQEIKQLAEQLNLKVNIVPNDYQNDSLTIILQNGKLEHWVDPATPFTQ